MSKVLGLICSKCNAKIPSDNIHVDNTVEYEGIEVCKFTCPECGQVTDDLQSEYWTEKEIREE